MCRRYARGVIPWCRSMGSEQVGSSRRVDQSAPRDAVTAAPSSPQKPSSSLLIRPAVT
jgi:hypothetical protein